MKNTSHLFQKILYTLLGHVSYLFKDYKRGIRYFQKCLELRKKKHIDSLYDYDIGFGFYHLKNFKSAVIHFEKYINRKPDDLRALFYLGVSYSQLALTSVTDAEEKFRLLTTAEIYIERTKSYFAPNNWGFYVTLGIIKKLLGKREEARACYLKALAIEPKAQMAKDRLAELEADAR